jgi:6-phosphogluconate dehydrogenase
MRPMGRFRVVEQARNGLDDLQLVNRCNQIFAQALADQLAIQDHIVDVADQDNLGRWITDLRQLAELGQNLIAIAFSLKQKNLRR